MGVDCVRLYGWLVILSRPACSGGDESRSEPDPNIKGKRSFVPKIWKSVTFCDISKCHNVTILNFVTFLGFCHTVCIFFIFFSKIENVGKCRNVTKCHKSAACTGLFSDVQQISTFRTLSPFGGCLIINFSISLSKLRFAVVWLGQIHNLDTGYVYLIGLRTSSERLWARFGGDWRSGSINGALLTPSYLLSLLLLLNTLHQVREMYQVGWYGGIFLLLE